MGMQLAIINGIVNKMIRHSHFWTIDGPFSIRPLGDKA